VKIKRVTPLLFVTRIEPVLPLWCKQLGYEEVVSVPRGEVKGFALLARGEDQVMLQTRDSLAEDLPAIAKLGVTSALYTDVESLEAALEAVKGAETIVDVRTTFYGAREAAIRDASGQVLIFSEHQR